VLAEGLVPRMPEIPEPLFNCLKDIYITLVPFCLKLREYADERPWGDDEWGPLKLRHWATGLEVVRGEVGNSIFLPGLHNNVLTGLVFLANEDDADQLKECVEGVRPVLQEYKLPSHEEELTKLSALADTLMSSTKEAQESIRGPLEKASNEFFERKFGAKKRRSLKRRN